MTSGLPGQAPPSGDAFAGDTTIEIVALGGLREFGMNLMMEADGLVSSGAGGKARDVLVPANYFEEVDNRYDSAVTS